MLIFAVVKFGTLLGIRRKAAGNSSARAFFKNHGGTPFFACSYKQYLNVEAGRSVPGPRLFGKIVAALSRSASSAIGKEHLFDRAVRHGFAQRKHSLSEKQAVFVRRGRANFWTFTALVHDSGEFSQGELAAAVRLPAAEVAKSLAGLVKLKLAVRSKRGVYSSPLAKKIILFPAQDPRGGYGIPDIDAEFEALAAKHGGVDFEQNFFVRAAAADMGSLRPILTESVRSAEIFTTQEKRGDTAFFRVRAQILKILPF